MQALTFRASVCVPRWCMKLPETCQELLQFEIRVLILNRNSWPRQSTLWSIYHKAEEIDGSEKKGKKEKAQQTIHSFTLALNALVP